MLTETIRKASESGAVAVEYALLIGLIAVLLLGVVGSIGMATDANLSGAMRIFVH